MGVRDGRCSPSFSVIKTSTPPSPLENEGWPALVKMTVDEWARTATQGHHPARLPPPLPPPPLPLQAERPLPPLSSERAPPRARRGAEGGGCAAGARGRDALPERRGGGGEGGEGAGGGGGRSLPRKEAGLCRSYRRCGDRCRLRGSVSVSDLFLALLLGGGEPRSRCSSCGTEGNENRDSSSPPSTDLEGEPEALLR